MMIRGLTIAGLNCSEFVQREGMTVQYQPITGLSEVWTEDLTLHDDLLGYRRVFSFALNPLSEANAKQLLTVLRASTVSVVINDPAKGTYETINCQPVMPTIFQKLTHSNGASYWQLSDLVLNERVGSSV